MQSRVHQNDRRATWQGLGDGLTLALELSVTPVLFTLLGLFLDRRVGTVPLFAVGFSVFAMVGVFVKAYYVYRFKAEQEEEARSWGKP